MNGDMNITPKDLVTYKGDNGLYSGGYKLNGLFSENNFPPITTMNENKQFGGNINAMSERFNGLGIPAGLSNLMSYSMQKYYPSHSDIKNDDNTTDNHYNDDCQHIVVGVLPTSLFDKLLALAGPENIENTNNSKKKRVTRKKIHVRQKQTKTSDKKSRKTRKGH